MTQPRIVGGRYELGELIGYGGMAEVHRGRDTRLNREVAIKVLRADLARDPSFLNRFRREAHSAAGLNHPSIVSVYDTGEDIAPDGTPRPFIVMEFVDGRTLRDILKSEGRLPVRRALEIVAEICSALDFSHRNGIIHRDIKPANVMITPQGAVKVMDFGIARAVADNSATQTQTANVIGTAQYLSPEQARGESVDARSDVYSTGCLLYELVTGVPPFQGDSPVAVAYQHVRENPVLPSARNPEVPRVVDSIVMKSLAKNQLNRYQSAGEMRQDIVRALANQPVVAEAVMTDAERTQFIARTSSPLPVRTPDYPPEDEPNHRRTGLIWAAVVVALLVVIGGAAYAIAFLGKGSSGPKTYAVPNVIGLSPTAAAEQLSQHFTAQVGAAVNGQCDNGAAVKVGQVCTLSLPPGSSQPEKTVIVYHLYAQKLQNVPPLTGKQLADAVYALRVQGLDYNSPAIQKNDVAPEGQVIAQDPAPGTPEPPGFKVTLTVSTGKIPLPDVHNLTFDQARQKLNAAQFNDVQQGNPTTTHDKAKDGLVADESPTPGGAYAPTQTITLSIYQYVAPPPPSSSCASTPGGSSSSSSGGSSSSASSSASSSPTKPC